MKRSQNWVRHGNCHFEAPAHSSPTLGDVMGGILLFMMTFFALLLL